MTARGSEISVHVADNAGLKPKVYFGWFSCIIKITLLFAPQQQVSMLVSESPCKITYSSLFICYLRVGNPGTITLVLHLHSHKNTQHIIDSWLSMGVSAHGQKVKYSVGQIGSDIQTLILLDFCVFRYMPICWPNSSKS